MRKFAYRAVIAAAGPAAALALAATTAAAPAHPAGHRAASSAPAAASAPSVPAGPVAVSFFTARAGFVLGSGGCGPWPCAPMARLVKTTNSGAAWSAVTAPAVPLDKGGTSVPPGAVSDVRFANAEDGWLFGPGLWATHDGGRHWARIHLPGKVSTLATSGQTVIAAARGGLFRARVDSDHWSLEPGTAGLGGALTLFGQSGWTAAPSGLWTTTDLAGWHKLPFQCPSPFTAETDIAAASRTRVAVMCIGNGAAGSIGKLLFRSADGGRSFQRIGEAPLSGTGSIMLAVPPGHVRQPTMTSSSGASWIFRSADGGLTWHAALTSRDAGVGWADLAYVTRTTGWLIHGAFLMTGGAGSLLQTTSAGASWHVKPVTFAGTPAP
jgi:hypothetical protein